MFKTIKQAVDAYQEAREARLVKETEAAALKDKEKEIADYILARWPQGGRGTKWFVWSEEFIDWTITDCNKLYAYIHKTRLFSLLYKRLNQENVDAHTPKGSVLPGLGRRTTVKLHHRART